MRLSLLVGSVLYNRQTRSCIRRHVHFHASELYLHLVGSFSSSHLHSLSTTPFSFLSMTILTLIQNSVLFHPVSRTKNKIKS